jgi:hypothetical protein
VDGHNWIFSIIFELFESDLKESWTWFFHQLHKAIRKSPLLAIYSDVYRGLTLVVKEVFSKVDITTEVSAPLGRRTIGTQRKNRIKRCLEGGSEKRPTRNETRKVRKLIYGKFKCPNCDEFGHRKNSLKCPHSNTKKR